MNNTTTKKEKRKEEKTIMKKANENQQQQQQQQEQQQKNKQTTKEKEAILDHIKAETKEIRTKLNTCQLLTNTIKQKMRVMERLKGQLNRVEGQITLMQMKPDALMEKALDGVNNALSDIEYILRKATATKMFVKTRFNKKLKHRVTLLDNAITTLAMCISYQKANKAHEHVVKLGLLSGYALEQEVSDAQKLSYQADAHYFGHGVPINKKAALRLYMAAADAGDTRAAYLVGKCCVEEETMAKEVLRMMEKKQAVTDYGMASLLKACDANHMDALYYTAKLYDDPPILTITKNIKEALKYYYRGAKASHVKSMIAFANKLLDGEGIKQTTEWAVKWLEKAVAMGSNEAANELGIVLYRGREDFKSNPRRAVALFEQAAEHIPAALHHLGIAYEEGQGVEPSMDKAMHYYEKAYAAHYEPACVSLGYLYLVKQQYDQGITLLLRGADAHQQPRAFFYLAQCYERGLGVLVDMDRATRYLQQCIEQLEYPPALHALGNIHFTKEHYTDALHYYERAALLQHAESANALGILYEDGHGVPPNEEKALAYFEQAFPLVDAYFNAGALYEKLNQLPDAKICYGKAAAHHHLEAAKRLQVLTSSSSPDQKKIKKDVTL